MEKYQSDTWQKVFAEDFTSKINKWISRWIMIANQELWGIHYLTVICRYRETTATWCIALTDRKNMSLPQDCERDHCQRASELAHVRLHFPWVRIFLCQTEAHSGKWRKILFYVCMNFWWFYSNKWYRLHEKDMTTMYLSHSPSLFRTLQLQSAEAPHNWG